MSNSLLYFLLFIGLIISSCSGSSENSCTFKEETIESYSNGELLDITKTILDKEGNILEFSQINIQEEDTLEVLNKYENGKLVSISQSSSSSNEIISFTVTNWDENGNFTEITQDDDQERVQLFEYDGDRKKSFEMRKNGELEYSRNYFWAGDELVSFSAELYLKEGAADGSDTSFVYKSDFNHYSYDSGGEWIERWNIFYDGTQIIDSSLEKRAIISYESNCKN